MCLFFRMRSHTLTAMRSCDGMIFFAQYVRTSFYISAKNGPSNRLKVVIRCIRKFFPEHLVTRAVRELYQWSLQDVFPLDCAWHLSLKFPVQTYSRVCRQKISCKPYVPLHLNHAPKHHQILVTKIFSVTICLSIYLSIYPSIKQPI